MNNWNRNNRKNPTPIKDAIQKLPYGFAPVDKSKLTYKGKQSLNTYSHELYTGHIDCKMYVLNRIIVGNHQVSTDKQKSEIYPLVVDNRILIPSTTLKSCVANFLAAYLGYPLSRVNEEKYGLVKKPAPPEGSDSSNMKRYIEYYNLDYCKYDKQQVVDGKLNVIEELFGYSLSDMTIEHKNRAKSGKVHFSYAVASAEYVDLRKEMSLPFAGSPYTDRIKFYFRKKTNARMNNATPSPRLVGRKFYFSTEEANTKGKECRKLHDVLVANETYPEFRFQVHFENMKKDELDRLCFGLCLGQNFKPVAGDIRQKNDVAYCKAQALLCHQIGYGKNFGMGAVKVVIENESDSSAQGASVTRVVFNENSKQLEQEPYYPDFENLSKNLNGDLLSLVQYYKEPRAYPLPGSRR
jgi:hypothetical protein